jgi:hypothetical protein
MRSFKLLVVALTLMLSGLVVEAQTTTAVPATLKVVASVKNPSVLNWVLPTTRANGAALTVAELQGIVMYKDGAKYITLGVGTAWQTPLCMKGTWTVTAVDTNGLESTQSTSVVIDTTLDPSCAPGPATGLKAVAS